MCCHRTRGTVWRRCGDAVTFTGHPTTGRVGWGCDGDARGGPGVFFAAVVGGGCPFPMPGVPSCQRRPPGQDLAQPPPPCGPHTPTPPPQQPDSMLSVGGGGGWDSPLFTTSHLNSRPGDKIEKGVFGPVCATIFFYRLTTPMLCFHPIHRIYCVFARFRLAAGPNKHPDPFFLSSCFIYHSHLWNRKEEKLSIPPTFHRYDEIAETSNTIRYNCVLRAERRGSGKGVGVGTPSASDP